jgi:hypothetical protein
MRTSIIQYLRDTTERSPDRAYVAEWRFFIESKGRSLSDSDLIRSYTFAAGFIEKWQNARINIPVRYQANFRSYLVTDSEGRVTANVAFYRAIYMTPSNGGQVGLFAYIKS